MDRLNKKYYGKSPLRKAFKFFLLNKLIKKSNKKFKQIHRTWPSEKEMAEYGDLGYV